MGTKKWVAVLSLVLVACAHASKPKVENPQSAVQFWVDAAAVPDGDGSVEHPWKKMPAMLVEGARYHLKTGTYLGSISMPPDCELIGQGTVVLEIQDSNAIAVTIQRGRIQNVDIQGGLVGALISEKAEFEQVTFRSQREVAIKLQPHASLSGNRLQFKGTVTESNGILAASKTQVDLKTVGFEGAYRRAIDAQESTLNLNDVHAFSIAEVIRLKQSELHLENAEFVNGRQAAIRIIGGNSVIRNVEVKGFEYALQASSNAKIDIDGFKSNRALLAALSFNNVEANLRNLQTRKSGSFGAVQVSESKLELDHAVVNEPVTMGISIRKSQVHLKNIKVTNVKQEEDTVLGPSGGDGFHLRDVRGEVRNIDVENADGACIWISAGSALSVFDLNCHKAGVAGILVELGSNVMAQRLNFFDLKVPALSVPDRASLKASDWTVERCETPMVWAECAKGSFIENSGKHPSISQSACIR